jgi:hypothetical protein
MDALDRREMNTQRAGPYRRAWGRRSSSCGRGRWCTWRASRPPPATRARASPSACCSSGVPWPPPPPRLLLSLYLAVSSPLSLYLVSSPQHSVYVKAEAHAQRHNPFCWWIDLYVHLYLRDTRKHQIKLCDLSQKG